MTGVRPLRDWRLAAWAAASAMVVLTLLAVTTRLAEPDIAYFLYSAGRLLDGATLYRDLVDLNPPPIFAFNLPIAWLARAAHVPDLLLYQLVTALVVGGALLFVRRQLGRYLLPSRPVERRFVLLLLCFVLFPLSREDFGQREHLVLALLLPYLATVIARVNRLDVARGDAGAAGALAGLAITLKPPFAIAWVAVEAWYRLVGRVEPWRFTPELWGVVVVTASYIVAVVTMTPDYVRLVLLLGGAFTTYLHSPPLYLLLLAPGAVLTAFAALAVIATRGAGPDSRARALLAVAMLGSFLAAVAQQKDLRYHFYPSFALATLVLGLVAAQTTSRAGVSARSYSSIAKYVVAAVVLVALGGAVLDSLGGSPADRRRRAAFGELLDAVRTRARGEPIGVLSYHMGSAFPLVNYAQVGLASRFACLWLFPAIYGDALLSESPIRYRTPAEMQAPELLLNQAVTEDLVGARPRLLLILRPFPDERRYGFRRLNYVEYFGREPRLANLFAGYQLIGAKGQYDIYERLDPGMPRPGAAPSAAVQSLQEAAARSPGAPALVDPELAAGAVIFVALGILSVVRRRSSR